jgi:hypothetical protein
MKKFIVTISLTLCSTLSQASEGAIPLSRTKKIQKIIAHGENSGSKTNTLLITEEGGCHFLHNIQGTLIATNDPDFNPTGYEVPHGCPELTGLPNTCEKPLPLAVDPGETGIPFGELCSYSVWCDRDEHYSPHLNNLLIPRAEVACVEKNLVNDDGIIKIMPAK